MLGQLGARSRLARLLTGTSHNAVLAASVVSGSRRAHWKWRLTRVRPDGKLNLSLGRGRSPIVLHLPKVEDRTGGVPVARWGEIQLCWDRDGRRFSLHLSYDTSRPVLTGGKLAASDEGIINPMAVATREDDGSYHVLVVNGREGSAIKRLGNKEVGDLQEKLSKTKNGSKRPRRLTLAKKRVQGEATRQLRDFDHHIAKKVADHLAEKDVGTVVVGDVRAIAQETRKRQRASRSARQQLSQWSRGRQERYLEEKTGVPLVHLTERTTTKTCPKCHKHNRPRGRDYRCSCGFRCHRDAVGAVNILQKALYGVLSPIDPDAPVEVTYLRAVPRWSPVQRQKHSARSSAQNQPSVHEAVPGCVGDEASSLAPGLPADPVVHVAA